VFDKAEAAENVELLKAERDKIEAEIKDLEGKKGQASAEEAERLARHIEHRKNRIKFLAAAIESAATPEEE
jgi:cell division protein FtsB